MYRIFNSVATSHRNDRLNQLKVHLDALVADQICCPRVDNDPVGLVHAYQDPLDIEIAGLVSALLAFGNITVVRRNAKRILKILGDHPADGLASINEKYLRAQLVGFVHRVYRADDIATLLLNTRRIQCAYGSLGNAFYYHWRKHAGDFRESAARFADELRGASAHSKSLLHLIPDPRRGSACKRLMLFFRWMIRPRDGIDFGLWDVPASALLIPVDTHILRMAQHVELTRQRTASWSTSKSITAMLATLDSNDPVRYDFALCHFGVSRACPSRRDPAICTQCVLRPVCKHGRQL